MTPTLSISIHDDNNLGDRVCNPCDYFDELKDVKRWNAWDSDWRYSPANLIFGGGGLVHGELEHHIRMVTRRPDRKLIAWGLGHNRDGSATIDYKDTLDGFDLLGVRDYKTAQQRGWDYVPCASCMSNGFDHGPIEKEHKYFVFQHWQCPITLRGARFPVPFMLNDSVSFGDAVKHLWMADVVITNTYHGAYWALLLGRKVLIYKPFSSRFYDFKHQPPFCDETNWKDVEPLAAPSGYLEECRELNRKFYEKVKATLGIHSSGITHDDNYYPYFGRTAPARRDASDSASQSVDTAQLPVAESADRSVPERPRDGGEHAAGHDQQNKELNAGADVIP